MKKLIFTAVLTVLACAAVNGANPVLNNPNNKAYFGIRLGGEVTCPGDLTEDNVSVSYFSNGGGIEIGGIYNFPVVANFYLEPGLKLYYNAYSVKKSWLHQIDDDIKSITENKFGFRIPVMAGYHFDFKKDLKLHVFTGPELEVGLIGKECMKAFGETVSENIYGDEGSMKRVDVLWGLGAGVTYKKLYFGISGSFGMLNMIDGDGASFHENRATFTIGYNF